jgi:hypothetical protein
LGVILDTLKDALQLMDEAGRKLATEALERVEELYYNGRIDGQDAFFMALGVAWFYVMPLWPRDVGNLARALGVDLERIGY